MRCDMLPELRPYLEGILDEVLAQSEMTISNEQMRENVLCQLTRS